MKNFLVIRLIALVVCLCFSANTILLAAPEVIPNLSSQFALSKPLDISIPTDFGKIDEMSLPTNCLQTQKDCSFVIYLQDAHANLGAQKSIQKILRLFSEKLSIHTVLTEGASGKANLSSVRAYSDQKIKQLTTEFFLREVILTGMEAEAILSPFSYEIFGIENQVLYDKNTAQFNRAFQLGKSQRSRLDELIEENNQLRSDHDNSELKKFEKKTSFFEKRSELIQLVSYLMNRGRELGVKRGDLAHIENLISLILLERSMESENQQQSLRAPKGRGNLGSKIASASPRNDSKEQEEFLKLSKEIGASELFRELDELKSRIRARLFVTPEEEIRFRESLYLKNLTSLLSLQATPKDVRDFEDQRLKILTFANNSGLSQNAIEAAESFYKTSIEREESFFQNVKSQIQEKKKVFLVTGGFHADHLIERFQREQIPFIVISPAVSPETNFDRYYERLHGEKVTFEKFESKFREFIKSSAILFQPQIFDPAFAATALKFFDAVDAVTVTQKGDSHQLIPPTAAKSELRQTEWSGTALTNQLSNEKVRTVVTSDEENLMKVTAASASRATRASSELRGKKAAETMDFKSVEELRASFTETHSIQVKQGEKFSLASDGIDSPEILNVMFESVDRQRVRIVPKSYEWALVKKSVYQRRDLKKIHEMFKPQPDDKDGFWLSSSSRDDSMFVVRKRAGKIVVIGEIALHLENIVVRTIPGVYVFPHNERLTYPTSLIHLFSRLRVILRNREDLVKELDDAKDGMWVAILSLIEQSLRKHAIFETLARILVVNINIPILKPYFEKIATLVEEAIKKLILETFENPYYRIVIKGNLMWYLMDNLQPAVHALEGKFGEDAKKLNDRLIGLTKGILDTYYREHLRRAEVILNDKNKKRELDQLKIATNHLKKAGKYLDRIKKYYSRVGHPNMFQSEERSLAKDWGIVYSQFRKIKPTDNNGSSREIENLLRSAKKARIRRFEEAMREGGRTPYDVDVEELIGLAIAEDLNSTRHFIIRKLSRLVNYNSLADILIGDLTVDKKELGNLEVLADRRTPLAVMLALTKLGNQGSRLGTRLYQASKSQGHDGRRQPVIDVLAKEIRSLDQTDERGELVLGNDGRPLRFLDIHGDPVPGSNLYDAHILRNALIKLEADIKKHSKWNYDTRISAALRYYNEIVNLDMPAGGEKYKPFTPDPELMIHLLIHGGVFQNIPGLQRLHRSLRHILELNVFGEIREQKGQVTAEDVKHLLDSNEWLSEARIGSEGREILRQIFILIGFLDPQQQFRDLIPEIVRKMKASPDQRVIVQEWPSHYTPVSEARYVIKRVISYLNPDQVDRAHLDLQGLPLDFSYGEGVRATQLNKHMVQKLWFLKFLSGFIDEVGKQADQLRTIHYDIASRTRGEVGRVMHEKMIEILKDRFDEEVLSLLSDSERSYIIEAEQKATDGQSFVRNRVIESKADNLRRTLETIFDSMMPQLVGLISSSKTEGPDQEGKFPSPSAEQVIRAFHLVKPGVPVIDVHLTILPKQRETDREPSNVTATAAARKILGSIPIQILPWSQVVAKDPLAPVNQLADPEKFDSQEPVIFWNGEVHTQKIKPLPKKDFLEALLGTFFMSYSATIRGHEGKASDWDTHQIYDHMLETELRPEDIKFGEERLAQFVKQVSEVWTETPIILLYGRHRPLEPTRQIMQHLSKKRTPEKSNLRNQNPPDVRSELRQTGRSGTAQASRRLAAKSELRMAKGLFGLWKSAQPEELQLKGGHNQVYDVVHGLVMRFEPGDLNQALYSLETHWDTQEDVENIMPQVIDKFKEQVKSVVEQNKNLRRKIRRLIIALTRKAILAAEKDKIFPEFHFQILASGEADALKTIVAEILQPKALTKDEVKLEEEKIKAVTQVLIRKIQDGGDSSAASLAIIEAFKDYFSETQKKIINKIQSRKIKAIAALAEETRLIEESEKRLVETKSSFGITQAAKMKEIRGFIYYLISYLSHEEKFHLLPNTDLGKRKEEQARNFSNAIDPVMVQVQKTKYPDPIENFSIPELIEELRRETLWRIETGDHAEFALSRALLKTEERLEKEIAWYKEHAVVPLMKNRQDILEFVRDDFRELVSEIYEKVTKKYVPQERFQKTRNLIVVTQDMSTPVLRNLLETYPNLKAVVTKLSSAGQHWTMVASGLGILTITSVQQPDLFDKIQEGSEAYADGVDGVFHVNPVSETKAVLEEKIIQERILSKLADKYVEKPAEVRHSDPPVEIFLGGNIDSVDEVEKTALVAPSVDLFRTENDPVLILREWDFDESLKEYEDKFTEELVRIIRKLRDGVVVRMLDRQADKIIKGILKSNKAYGLEFYKTERGNQILRAQMRALIHAYLETEASGKIKILFPMIKTKTDRNWLIGIWREEAKAFEARGYREEVNGKRVIPVGLMIETNEAMGNLNELLDKNVIDFVSVGTNDLTQQTFKISRDTGDVVYHTLQPKLLMRIEEIVRVAAEKEIGVSICGDLASWRRFSFFAVYLVKKYGVKLKLAAKRGVIARNKNLIRFVTPEEIDTLFKEYGEKPATEETNPLDEDAGKLKVMVEERIKTTKSYGEIEPEIREERSKELAAFRASSELRSEYQDNSVNTQGLTIALQQSLLDFLSQWKSYVIETVKKTTSDRDNETELNVRVKEIEMQMVRAMTQINRAVRQLVDWRLERSERSLQEATNVVIADGIAAHFYKTVEVLINHKHNGVSFSGNPELLVELTRDLESLDMGAHFETMLLKNVRSDHEQFVKILTAIRSTEAIVLQIHAADGKDMGQYLERIQFLQKFFTGLYGVYEQTPMPSDSYASSRALIYDLLVQRIEDQIPTLLDVVREMRARGNRSELRSDAAFIQGIQTRFRGPITKAMLDNEINSINQKALSQSLEDYVKTFLANLYEVFTKRDLDRYLSTLPELLKKIYDQNEKVRRFFSLLAEQLPEEAGSYVFTRAILNHSAGFHVRPAMIFKSLIKPLADDAITVIVTTESMENYVSNRNDFTSLFAENQTPLLIYLETHRPDLASRDQLQKAAAIIKEYIEDPKVGDDVELQVEKTSQGEDIERFPSDAYRTRYADRLNAIFTSVKSELRRINADATAGGAFSIFLRTSIPPRSWPLGATQTQALSTYYFPPLGGSEGLIHQAIANSSMELTPKAIRNSETKEEKNPVTIPAPIMISEIRNNDDATASLLYGSSMNSRISNNSEIVNNYMYLNKISGKIIVSILELEQQPSLVEAIKKSITENPNSAIEIAMVAGNYAKGIDAEPIVQKIFGDFDIFGKNSESETRPRAQLYTQENLGVARNLPEEQAYSMLIDKLRKEFGATANLTTRLVAIGERGLLANMKQKVAKVTSAAESLMLAELLIATDDADQYVRFADEFGIISPTTAILDSLMHTILEKALVESAA